MPITVAARYKARTVLARSNAGIVGSNLTQGMDVCICVYSVFVLSCVYVAALRRAITRPRSPTVCVKNDYGTEEEIRAQQGLKYHLKILTYIYIYIYIYIS
jgi:hypothetical protein